MSFGGNDLPLVSNIDTVRARHYVWCAHPVLASRRVCGQVIIVFSSPTRCEVSESNCAQCKCHDNIRPQSCTSLDYSEGKSNVPVVLDVKDLIVKSVSSVACCLQDLENYLCPTYVKNTPAVSRNLFSLKRDAIEFAVDTWSLKFECPKKLPFAIFIEYHTTETSSSLSWRNEGRNPCFFTSGSAINNRALLPCQDAPSALATWEAFIFMDSSFHVSMSGDEPGFVLSLDSETLIDGTLGGSLQRQNISANSAERCHYFYSSLPLPLATLAIAAGVWTVEKVIIPCSLQRRDFAEENRLYSSKESSDAARTQCVSAQKKCTHEVLCCHSPYPCIIEKILKLECYLQNCAGNLLPVHDCSGNANNSSKFPQVSNSCDYQGNGGETWSSTRFLSSTLVYPASLDDQLKPLKEFLPYCLSAAAELLGPHPCPRLEIVVMPSSFASLGLASPNLVFLAPCVATAGDSSTFLRIAHEISHAWFGIIIGAVDWTEEWLSEGFATFAEELVYEKASVSFREVLFERRKELLELGARDCSHEISSQSCENDLLASCSSSKFRDKMGSFKTVRCENRMNVCDTSNDLCDNSTRQTASGKHNSDTDISGSTNLIRSSNMICSDEVQYHETPELLTASGRTKISCNSSPPSHKRQKLNDSRVSTAAATDFNSEFSNWEIIILSADEGIREEMRSIRDYLRYKKLTQEIQVTDDGLQTLLPQNGNSSEGGNFVLNGLQKEKPFLSVHYIKGFFFLKYLCSQTGRTNFCNFLKKFVLKFHGQLITSRNFLDYLCAEFPEISASKSNLMLEWLQSSGVNQQLKNMNDASSMTNSLPKAHYAFWTSLKSKKNVSDCDRVLKEIGPLCYPERIQLFLEYLLEYDGHLTKHTMLAIEQLYDLERQNSDVRHVWCELIIKHNYRPGSHTVEKFLAGDQAMGIYLYGELMISGTHFWQALARRVYQLLQDNMEESTRTNIFEMLYSQ